MLRVSNFLVGSVVASADYVVDEPPSMLQVKIGVHNPDHACVPVHKGDVAPSKGLFNGLRVEIGEVAQASGTFCVEKDVLALVQRSFARSSAQDVDATVAPTVALQRQGRTPLQLALLQLDGPSFSAAQDVPNHEASKIFEKNMFSGHFLDVGGNIGTYTESEPAQTGVVAKESNVLRPEQPLNVDDLAGWPRQSDRWELNVLQTKAETNADSLLALRLPCRSHPCWSPYHSTGVQPHGVPSCADALFNMLVAVAEGLNSHGLDWRICEGTLLGAERDEEIIPWTADVDLCLTEASFLRFREYVQSPANMHTDYVFGNANTEYIRGCGNFPTGDAYDFSWQNLNFVYMDLYNTDRINFFDNPMREIMNGPKKNATIRGKKFPAPQDAKQFLEMTYGPNWSIPDHTHSPHG